MDIQEEINQIYNDFPWASNETANNVARELSKSNFNFSKVSAVLAGVFNESQVNDLLDRTQNTKSEASRFSTLAETSGKNIKNSMRNLVAANPTPQNMADISHQAARVLDNMQIAISNSVPITGRFGRMADQASGFFTKGAVVATGVAAVYAALITEQEKATRQMIEYGLVVSDLDKYTALRNASSRLGLGLTESTQAIMQAKSFLAGGQTGLADSSQQLLNMIKDTYDDKSFNNFGYSIQDFSTAMAEEAGILYELGQVSEVNNLTKNRVRRSFESANALATFTANAIGMDRQTMLDARNNARQNVDFTTAILVNNELITDMFGENAVERIEAANGFMAMLNTATFGTEFAEEFTQDVSRTIKDYGFDTSAANNINSDRLQYFQTLGPAVANAYIKLVEDTASGKIGSETEALEAQRNFAKLVKESTTKNAGSDQMIKAANLMIAEAELIPESYFNANTIELSTSYMKDRIDEAGSSIDSLSELSAAFKQVQDTLTPGFKGMAVGFEMLTGNFDRLGNAFAKVMGRGDEYARLSADMRVEKVMNMYETSDQVSAARAQLAERTALVSQDYNYQVESQTGTNDSVRKLADELIMLEQYELALQEKANQLKQQAQTSAVEGAR